MMFAGFSAGQLLYDLSRHHRRSQKCSSPWYRHLHCRLRNLLKPPIFRPCWLDEPYKLLLFYVIAVTITRIRAELGLLVHDFERMDSRTSLLLTFGFCNLGARNLASSIMFKRAETGDLNPHPMPRHINSKENGWPRSCGPPTFYDRNAHSRCFELSYNVIFRH